MSGHRRSLPTIVVAAALALAAVPVMYQSPSVAAFAATLGSGAIVLAVLAHVGLLAAIVGAIIARFRRQRH